MTWTVRPATQGDLEALCDLFCELFAKSARGRPDVFRAPVADDPEERRLLRDYLARVMASEEEALLVACDANAVAGLVHVLVRIVPESPTVPFRRACREGWIQHVAVCAGYQRRGVGRALDRAARSWAAAHGAQTVGLQVWAYNEDGAMFFARMGYRARSLHLYDP